ncbi:MAG: hypothetical protein MUE85_00430 [Microscillaceae bacterium]|nr:hypothetical protein [Microscillaceae bacterium]
MNIRLILLFIAIIYGIGSKLSAQSVKDFEFIGNLSSLLNYQQPPIKKQPGSLRYLMVFKDQENIYQEKCILDFDKDKSNLMHNIREHMLHKRLNEIKHSCPSFARR